MRKLNKQGIRSLVDLLQERARTIREGAAILPDEVPEGEDRSSVNRKMACEIAVSVYEAIIARIQESDLLTSRDFTNIVENVMQRLKQDFRRSFSPMNKSVSLQIDVALAGATESLEMLFTELADKRRDQSRG